MYTKGEWKITDIIRTPTYNERVIIDRSGWTIAEVYFCDYGSTFAREDNARLIAAAPAMYEALKCWQTEGIVKATTPMMEAIAKVEGK